MTDLQNNKMTTLQNNIDEFRRILAEKEAILKQQKKEVKEKEEQSWEFNMRVIENITKQETRTANAPFSSLRSGRQNQTFDMQIKLLMISMIEFLFHIVPQFLVIAIYIPHIPLNHILLFSKLYYFHLNGD